MMLAPRDILAADINESPQGNILRPTALPVRSREQVAEGAGLRGRRRPHSLGPAGETNSRTVWHRAQ
jgi:hypothetical protein